tara:strand:- start:82 stop:384 length:303 start_codon:yes stop_codon:yes gene_type:complete
MKMGYYGKLPPLPDEGIRMKNGVVHYTSHVQAECVSDEELAIEAAYSKRIRDEAEALFSMVENVVLDQRKESADHWWLVCSALRQHVSDYLAHWCWVEGD